MAYRLIWDAVRKQFPAYLFFFFFLFSPGQAGGQDRGGLPEETNMMKFSALHDTLEIRKQITEGKALISTVPDSALTLLQQALSYAEQADFATGIIIALQNISYIYAEKGLYTQSLATLRKAIQYCNRYENAQSFLPQIYGGIGTVFQSQNNYEYAAKYYYQAILFAEQFPPAQRTGIARIYNNMAELFNVFGASEQAQHYLNMAETLAIQEEDMYLLESIRINRGIIYLSHHQFERSEEYFKNAILLADKYNLVKLKHFSLLNLSGLYLEKRQAHKALSHIRAAMSLTENINAANRNGALEKLGRALFQLGQYSQAEDTLLMAFSTAEKLHSTRQISNICATLAQLYATTGQYKKAFQYQAQHMLMKDSMTNQQIAENVNHLEMKYRVAEKDKELYQKQLFINQQEHRIEQKNILITSIAAGILILAGMLIGIYRNRAHKQQIWQLKAMMKGEEKERNRIGRELHDGIGGMLTAINMNVGAIQKRHQELPQMQDLNVITDMLQDMAAEIRKTSHNLMPDILLRHGFPETLSMYCDQINSGNSVQIDLQCYGNLDNLDRSLAFSLYRILQELIQNITKHARASHAVIQLRQHEDRLIISIEDNGCGFDTRHNYDGAGLQNIRSRVQALAGHISIESTLKRGTTVYIELAAQKMINSDIRMIKSP